MIINPLMTVFGIMFLRQTYGLHTTFEVHSTAGETSIFRARLRAVQFVFLGLGMVVLRRQAYFKDFVPGPKTSPGSYALICPGVALSVMLQFFINKWLVDAGIVYKFSAAYWVRTVVAIGFQMAMIWLLLRLNRHHFGTPPARVAVPAE